MTESPRLWMRHETRSTERRAPIVPADAKSLVDSGVEVTVEDSAQRVFPLAEYEAAGCWTAEPGSWVDAPRDCWIVGLKELPDEPAALAHRHVFFGHAYKGQHGAADLLRRFTAGGGALLDIEYLVDETGRRLAAFGFWAGYVGAALAVLRARGRLPVPLHPMTRAELDGALREPADGPLPTALVIGALGRSGRGAREALETAGITPTGWDVEETRNLDRAALLAHDILVNTVLTTSPTPPFLTQDDVADPGRRLALVEDVTCDATSDFNVLPIYRDNTTWEQPVGRLHDDPPLEIIAIDNLPSLLPYESSVAFSAELTPQLALLGGDSAAWRRCAQWFDETVASLESAR